MKQRCPSRLKTCRCRTAVFEKRSYRAVAAPRWFIKISCRPAAATIFSKNYRYRAAAAMVFKIFFRISLLRLYWTGNIGTSPSDSFSLRVFHL
jgi:hypothetical protein